jgi:hypothetical protein
MGRQLIELVQELVECVAADDPLAVRLGDACLPHPEPAVADDHLRVREPERLKSKYLVAPG